MKTILVATDFSYSSFNAARYAMLFARLFDECKVIVYHSCAVKPQLGDQFNPVREDAALRLAECKDRLQDIEVSLGPFRGPTTELECRTDFLPLAEGCAAIAKSDGAELVIMGSHGRSMVYDRLFGSHTRELIDKLVLPPILVVPPDFVFENVMVTVFAFELEHVEETPADEIGRIAHALGSHLVAVNAGPGQIFHQTEAIKSQQDKLEELLAPFDPEYFYIHGRPIEEALLRFAEKHKAGMLIVVHKMHGFFHRLLNDSMSRKLSAFGKLPVLVLKPKT